MTDLDLLDEQRSVRLKQRLWGAAVLIALAVIFLPLLLDGAGSESEYRRVERLREEPPRLTGDATLDTNKLSGRLKENAQLLNNVTKAESVVPNEIPTTELSTGATDNPQITSADRRLDRSSVAAPSAMLKPTPNQPPAPVIEKKPNTAPISTANGTANVAAVAPETAGSGSADLLNAWVVQAGSFRERENALAVRDRLRRAGFPSFVTETKVGALTYRVQVGPMINLQQAERSRDKVIALLKRDAIVVSYP